MIPNKIVYDFHPAIDSIWTTAFRLVLSIPFLLAGCTTLPPQQSSTPQKQSQISDPNTFTEGDTRDHVAKVMGTPSKIQKYSMLGEYWYFGNSHVVFKNGRVSEWSNDSNNLKVRWKNSSAPASVPAKSRLPVGSAIRKSNLSYSNAGLYISTGRGHWIESVSGNGSIITLEDSSVWQVDSYDTYNTALWLPISSITVVESGSAYLLINTDDGEKAHARLLHQ